SVKAFPPIPKKQLDYLATAEVLGVYRRVVILQNPYVIMDSEAYLSLSLSFLCVCDKKQGPIHPLGDWNQQH
ncbi:hypothetical protein, partial [Rubritalea profundi]